MRGKPRHIRRNSNWLRNIPAYAGKTHSPGNVRGGWEEHPRVCGENLENELALIKVDGTSPRMRGKLLGKKPVIGGFRNIPAYAGKTGSISHALRHAQEHPRVCGENSSR